jgi:hypothetical protein
VAISSRIIRETREFPFLHSIPKAREGSSPSSMTCSAVSLFACLFLTLAVKETEIAAEAEITKEIY